MNPSIGGCALSLAVAAFGLAACSTPQPTASANSAASNASATAPAPAPSTAPTRNPASVVSGADGVTSGDAAAGAPTAPTTTAP